MPPPVVNEGSSTNGTFASLANPDSDGKNYRKGTWTASGSFVLTNAGWVEYLVVGAGGPYVTSTYDGAGGYVLAGWTYLAAGTHTVTIGAATLGSSSVRSGFSLLGTIKAMGGTNTTGGSAIGAGDGTYGEYTSVISGTSQKYAGGGLSVDLGTTTYGSGGRHSVMNPQNGVVIARWEI